MAIFHRDAIIAIKIVLLNTFFMKKTLKRQQDSQLELFPGFIHAGDSIPENISELTRDVVKHIIEPTCLKNREIAAYNAKRIKLFKKQNAKYEKNTK